ncbi:MAG: TraR/DksA C4-type zinc finger protein [Verrucomicrobia bacterium]|nr:TraR/DksA C4-type zinc finger protein [Verrucomicrobiota bacterium]
MVAKKKTTNRKSSAAKKTTAQKRALPKSSGTKKAAPEKSPKTTPVKRASRVATKKKATRKVAKSPVQARKAKGVVDKKGKPPASRKAKSATAAKKKVSQPMGVVKRKSNGLGAIESKNGKASIRKLTAKQLRDFQQMLIAMREQLSGQVSSLRGDSLQRFDEVNTNEDGTDAFERQFALSLASAEQDIIYEIDEALRRIQSRTYGICEVSGEAIEIERLKAIPFTRHSLSAQAEIESKQGQLRQSVVRRGLM